MNLDRKGKTFVISGPSGVGKSTVLKALFEGRDDLYFSVSATTRAPRPGEEHGVNYYFIEPEMFHQWITDGEFLEYAEYVGNSPEKVQERLLRAKVELKSADQYDYFVINDNVENAVAELRAIMLAEHCRPTDRIHLLREA